MKVLIACAAVVALTACEKPVEEMGYAEQVQLVDQIIARCAALGIPKNSPQMQQCGEAEINKEIYTRRANQVRMQNAGIAMQQASANYQRSLDIQNASRVNCTHTPTYNGAYRTSCY